MTEQHVRIGAAASALGVSVDTLRRWERDGRVSFERSGGQRVLAATELARLLRERGSNRGSSSARNRLDGVVVSVQSDGLVAKVELACGPYRIVSLMTSEAAEELGLEPGVQAQAVVKSTNVIVDRQA